MQNFTQLHFDHINPFDEKFAELLKFIRFCHYQKYLNANRIVPYPL